MWRRSMNSLVPIQLLRPVRAVLSVGRTPTAIRERDTAAQRIHLDGPGGTTRL